MNNRTDFQIKIAGEVPEGRLKPITKTETNIIGAFQDGGFDKTDVHAYPANSDLNSALVMQAGTSLQDLAQKIRKAQQPLNSTELAQLRKNLLKPIGTKKAIDARKHRVKQAQTAYKSFETGTIYVHSALSNVKNLLSNVEVQIEAREALRKSLQAAEQELSDLKKSLKAAKREEPRNNKAVFDLALSISKTSDKREELIDKVKHRPSIPTDKLSLYNGVKAIEEKGYKVHFINENLQPEFNPLELRKLFPPSVAARETSLSNDKKAVVRHARKDTPESIQNREAINQAREAAKARQAARQANAVEELAALRKAAKEDKLPYIDPSESEVEEVSTARVTKADIYIAAKPFSETFTARDARAAYIAEELTTRALADYLTDEEWDEIDLFKEQAREDFVSLDKESLYTKYFPALMNVAYGGMFSDQSEHKSSNVLDYLSKNDLKEINAFETLVYGEETNENIKELLDLHMHEIYYAAEERMNEAAIPEQLELLKDIREIQAEEDKVGYAWRIDPEGKPTQQGKGVVGFPSLQGGLINALTGCLEENDFPENSDITIHTFDEDLLRLMPEEISDEADPEFKDEFKADNHRKLRRALNLQNNLLGKLQRTSKISFRVHDSQKDLSNDGHYEVMRETAHQATLIAAKSIRFQKKRPNSMDIKIGVLEQMADQGKKGQVVERSIDQMSTRELLAMNFDEDVEEENELESDAFDREEIYEQGNEETLSSSALIAQFEKKSVAREILDMEDDEPEAAPKFKGSDLLNDPDEPKREKLTASQIIHMHNDMMPD